MFECVHVDLLLWFLYTFEFIDLLMCGFRAIHLCTGACSCGVVLVYYRPTDRHLLNSFKVGAETVFAGSAFQSRIVLGTYENLW